jgi:hypothetical protein
MVKGPKQPRTKKEVLDRIVALALDKSKFLGKQIKAQLEKEFEPNDVPGLRTIQQYMSNARKEGKENVQEQPWSLGTMDKAGIPWEAAAWLLDHYKECEKRTMKGEQLWRLTNPYPIGTKPLEPVKGGWVFLTNRQAKWFWRVRPIVPAQKFPDPFHELCHWADQYAHAEITAEYLDQYFDTRTIDADLMMYRDAAKQEFATNEADSKQKQKRRNKT